METLEQKHVMEIMLGLDGKKNLREAMEEAGALKLAPEGVTAGDTKIMWDPTDDDEVAAAKGTYDRLRKKGYTAFATDKKGDQSKRMDEFDPDAGRIIMVKHIQGGSHG